MSTAGPRLQFLSKSYLFAFQNSLTDCPKLNTREILSASGILPKLKIHTAHALCSNLFTCVSVKPSCSVNIQLN